MPGGDDGEFWVADRRQFSLRIAAPAWGSRRFDDRDQIDELRRWGWVFGVERIELTGAGHYHAGTVVGGLIGRCVFTDSGENLRFLVIGGRTEPNPRSKSAGASYEGTQSVRLSERVLRASFWQTVGQIAVGD